MYCPNIFPHTTSALFGGMRQCNIIYSVINCICIHKHRLDRYTFRSIFKRGIENPISDILILHLN